jgi:23S rRNA (cytosine1962-C5)-methyltransferase
VERIILKKSEEKRIRSGHLWIFSNEITKFPESASNGDIVEVCDFKNNLLGIGFFNKNSLIAVRLISRDVISDFHSLFLERVQTAYQLRKDFYPQRESFRLVFSESDFLPGLIIDKYNKTFVLQINSFGMQKEIHLIIDILKSVFNAENIFTKNDFYLRKLEGLHEEDKVYSGKIGAEIIDDGFVKYQIDFNQSQKTGFYFDQADNRLFIRKIVKDSSVADVFCNSGGFGLHALSAGAKSVDFVDASVVEIENVKRNILLNKIEGELNYFVSDAFEFLLGQENTQKNYDVVILDPPAFAKSKKTLPAAEKGYEKLNRLALNIVKKDGYLVTSSCSYHMKKDNFINCINRAAVKSRRTIQLLHFNEASLDHPKLPSMEETSYLKFAVFRVF